MSGLEDVGVRYVEGPGRYSSTDVATAFSRALGRPVGVETISRDAWRATYRALGFSEPAADSYTRMMAASLDQGFDQRDDAIHGEVTLDTYIRQLVVRDTTSDV